MINIRTKATCRRKNLFVLHILIDPIQELNAQTWRQKLKQKPWRNSTYHLALSTCACAQPAFFYNPGPSV